MKVQTKRLNGVALDWAVAKAEGWSETGYLSLDAIARNTLAIAENPYSPSTDWAQGGPIIEREGIELKTWALDGWEAHATDYSHRPGNDEVFAQVWAKTPLVAAMRCYVASRIGDEIEIPEAMAYCCTED